MTTRIYPPGSPPPDDSDDEELPCGRLLSQVWSAWEDGATDTHQRTCLHCGEARRDLEELQTTVRQLRDDADRSSGFDAAALVQRVMGVVRLELRPGRPLPLGEPGDNMWIMESVAARTLRAAAEQVPGVRAGSCRITPDVTAATGRVTVRLGIYAPLSAPDLRELADRVRRAVQQAADQRLSMDIAGIDVHISDLVETPGDSTGKGADR
ncbi:Asp23/Gls24 family envelope stress response protein [Streptomyces sp. NPDC051322]|uniref:Asp23/Gls24 family envelope stress response protein n=1 Tax=Streptomyces sp. NPDC051322 TaxID=3154645 RepID=UPI00344BDA43